MQTFEQNAHRTTSSAPLTWSSPEFIKTCKEKPNLSFLMWKKSKILFLQLQPSLETSVEVFTSTAYPAVIFHLLLSTEENLLSQYCVNNEE